MTHSQSAPDSPRTPATATIEAGDSETPDAAAASAPSAAATEAAPSTTPSAAASEAVGNAPAAPAAPATPAVPAAPAGTDQASIDAGKQLLSALWRVTRGTLALRGALAILGGVVAFLVLLVDETRSTGATGTIGAEGAGALTGAQAAGAILAAWAFLDAATAYWATRAFRKISLPGAKRERTFAVVAAVVAAVFLIPPYTDLTYLVALIPWALCCVMLGRALLVLNAVPLHTAMFLMVLGTLSALLLVVGPLGACALAAVVGLEALALAIVAQATGDPARRGKHARRYKQ